MVYSFIEVESYAGTVLKQEFSKQNSSTLVILLPGIGYTIFGPLIYYSYSLAVELGYDVLTIEYGFQKTNQSFEQEHYSNIIDESKTAIDKALFSGNYNDIVFIGKSLGTGIMSNLLSYYQSILRITPIFIAPIKSAVDSIGLFKSLVIIGTNDSHFDDIKNINGLDNVHMYIIHGADHDLEVDNFIESIDYMKQCIICIRDFILKRDT